MGTAFAFVIVFLLGYALGAAFSRNEGKCTYCGHDNRTGRLP